jgi:hypothetical protein
MQRRIKYRKAENNRRPDRAKVSGFVFGQGCEDFQHDSV